MHPQQLLALRSGISNPESECLSTSFCGARHKPGTHGLSTDTLWEAWSEDQQHLVHANQERCIAAPADGVQRSMSLVSMVLLAAALSIHSLLEGVVLGAGQNVQRLLEVFLAIQAHKGLTAFALGTSLVQAEAPPGQFWAMVLVMVGATPIGIAGGVLLGGVANSNERACIGAIAAGTFIYVAIVEILTKELAQHDFKAVKLVALGVGFSLMSMLEIWA